MKNVDKNNNFLFIFHRFIHIEKEGNENKIMCVAEKHKKHFFQQHNRTAQCQSINNTQYGEILMNKNHSKKNNDFYY